MIISDAILKTQLCSECQQYLTVPPIKVYPNRHVECGRCVQDNDNAVVSRLYEMIMEQFEFPCVNRFEGCTEIMKFNDFVKKHEENCVAKTYHCPLCNNFTGKAYYLQLHLTRHHSLDELHHSEVVFDLDDEENGQKICWYLHKVGLVILFCKYNGHQPGKLWLDVAVLGERKPPVTQSFSLRSLKNNKIIYQTQDIPCSIWGRIPGNGFTIDIDQKQFPKRTVICVFDLKGHVANACKISNDQVKSVADMPKVIVNDASVHCNILNVENSVANTAEMNPSTSRNDTLNEYRVTETSLISSFQKFQFSLTSNLEFSRITSLKLNVKQYGHSYSSNSIGTTDFPYQKLKYYIRRNSEYLDIGLEYNDNDLFSLTPDLSATFTLLISSDWLKYHNNERNYTKQYTLYPVLVRKNHSVVFTNLIEWNTLMSLQFIYLQNDSLRIKACLSFW